MIRPFKTSTEAYRYFDMGRIASDLQVKESMVEAARELIREDKVYLEKVTISFRRFIDGTVKCLEANGAYVDGKGMRPLSCIFDREEFLYADCAVSSCYFHYYPSYDKFSPCVHQLAFLILVDEYIKKYNPGDATDHTANVLLRRFRASQGLKLAEEREETLYDLKLEMVLEKEKNDLYASLKVGTDRLYVVKNMTEFIRQYDGKDRMHFGTKTEIDFFRHRVRTEDEGVLSFVRHIVTEEKERNHQYKKSYYYYYHGEEIKQQILLYGSRLDQFYDIGKGKELAAVDKSGRKNVKTSYLLQDGIPKISLKIEKDMDDTEIFHGIRVHGRIPEFIKGEQYRYYFTKEAFCRVDGEMARNLEPLFEMEQYGNISFCVGRKNLSEFYYQVLPVLKENITIKEVEPDGIAEYIPPEAQYAFYLDAQEKNIVCKAEIRYGEEKVSLLDHMRQDKGFEWFRNLMNERETMSQVQKSFPLFDIERDELYCEETEEAVASLLDGGVDRLMTLGEVHTTERFRRIKIRKRPKIKLGVSIHSDIMNLTISSEDMEQEDLLQLLKNYRPKKKYYRLKSGDLISVNENDMDLLLQLMDTMQLSAKDLVKGNTKLPMYRALYLNKMMEQSENIYLNRDSHYKNMIKEFKTLDESEFEVPDSLSSIMRGYQIHGFKWLKTLEHYRLGGILADDMGLGKTLQAISLLLDGKRRQEGGTALIVSPASLVYNWKEEFQKYAPELDVTMVVGNQQERAEIIHNYEKSDVLVTSYDLLKRDIVEYENANFTYQILDEAQYIKNHSTAAAKSVKVINSRIRFALTGTPIENRLSELWSIFDYLMPGFLYRYETFRKELETSITKYKDEQASLRLKKMTAPFILRRLKADVLSDLPEKLEEIRYAKLEQEQQKLYDGQVVHMKRMLEAQKSEDFQKNKLQILAELTKIRQICCDPELLFEKYSSGSAKRQACIQLIQSAIEGEHKILVFSQFTSMLQLLEADLKEAQIDYFKITGETPKQKRVEMVNTFNNDTTPVFLISLKAGGTGLNLTGADVVIHYDPWWNQAAQNQATDRAHRIGQTRAVTVYKLIAKGTIEEKILKMQEAKKDLADAILSGDNGSITQMNKEEILELLE